MKKIIVILLIVAIVAGLCGYRWLTAPVTLAEETVVTVEEASATGAIGALLKENGVIRSELGFKLEVRKKNADGDLKPGTYHFKGENSVGDVVDALVSGPAISGVKVTIPEGYNQKQIIDTLAEAGVCSEAEFLEAAANGDFGYGYLPPAGDSLRLQGFLFPETYYFAEGDSAENVIAAMLAEFDKNYTDEMHQYLKDTGRTTYQWLTMASIVEKEAVVAEDRPIIAGVFYNRLEQGMALQSCATIQYALGEVKPVLSIADTQIDSPYNTYTHTGLPPGPIASPGVESMQAALHPAETDCLYFVAKPNGAHIFSKTYEEHMKAKADIEAGLYDNE